MTYSGALGRWSSPAPCPYCGRAVQLLTLPGRIPTRITSGTDSPHRCLRVAWCMCGEPIHPLPDGRRINVADDQPHACAEERASAVTVRATLPVQPSELPERIPPVIRRRAPAAQSGVDVPEVA